MNQKKNVTLIKIEKVELFFIISANSAKELLKPYFGDIIEQFKPYLAPHSEMGGLSEEDTRKLQIQTLGTAISYSCLQCTMFKV